MLPSVQLLYQAYPTLVVDGQAVPLGVKRGLALLVVLQELDHKVSRTKLAPMLWPDSADTLGRARLRRLCHATNKAMGVRAIVGDADSVWLDGSVCQFTSDVAAVRNTARDVLATPFAGVPEEALDSLGTPESTHILNTFVLDSALLADFVDSLRVTHHRLVVRALQRLSAHFCKQSRGVLAVEAARAMVQLDRYSDQGRMVLLDALSVSGDAAGIEASYFDYAELLRSELGIRPSAAFEKTYANAQALLPGVPPPARKPWSEPMPIRFVESSRGTVAFLDIGGNGPPLVMLFGLWSHIELAWEEPHVRAFLKRLSQHFRVVLLDRCGTGLSERLTVQDKFSGASQDVDAVRKALGVDAIWLLGNSIGGGVAMDYAASFPENTLGLILYATSARGSWAPDYPWALRTEQLHKWQEELQSQWGGATSLADFAPSVAQDANVRNWWASMLRQAASRNSIPNILASYADMDVRDRLAHIQTPTLVLQCEDDRIVRKGAAIHLASAIAGAQLVFLEGSDHLIWYGEIDAFFFAVAEFLHGLKAAGLGSV